MIYNTSLQSMNIPNKVWDTLANFTCLKTLKAHEGMVLALAVYQSTKLFR